MKTSRSSRQHGVVCGLQKTLVRVLDSIARKVSAHAINFTANILLMSRHHPARRRRNFSKLNKRYVKRNDLKKLSLVLRDVKLHFNIGLGEVEALLFCYDYEFFTITHLANAMSRSRKKLYERTILPLKQKGYVEVIHHGKEVDSYINALFHEKSGNEHRLGLSQSGRMLVQRIYRKLEGGEPINLEA